jgi:hypothetical protein
MIHYERRVITSPFKSDEAWSAELQNIKYEVQKIELRMSIDSKSHKANTNYISGGV